MDRPYGLPEEVDAGRLLATRRGVSRRAMNRRTFLASAGAAGTVGTVGLASTFVGSIDVRWWATPRAARHDTLRERVEEYVEFGFDQLALSATVSYGGVTSFPTENAYRLLTGGAWPRRLLMGGPDGRLDPVGGVNLLVTDSSIRRPPTGAGVPYVAAVGGASEIVRAPPVDSIGAIVPDRIPLRTVQILLHECGHALGLRHDHGTIRETGPAAVVSPMVSGYAWAAGPVRRRQFDFESNRCGRPYPPVEGREPRLRLQFDDCEQRGLARFRRPSLPFHEVARRDGGLVDLARSAPACPTCSALGEQTSSSVVKKH